MVKVCDICQNEIREIMKDKTLKLSRPACNEKSNCFTALRDAGYTIADCPKILNDQSHFYSE